MKVFNSISRYFSRMKSQLRDIGSPAFYQSPSRGTCIYNLKCIYIESTWKIIINLNCIYLTRSSTIRAASHSFSVRHSVINRIELVIDNRTFDKVIIDIARLVWVGMLSRQNFYFCFRAINPKPVDYTLVLEIVI